MPIVPETIPQEAQEPRDSTGLLQVPQEPREPEKPIVVPEPPQRLGLNREGAYDFYRRKQREKIAAINLTLPPEAKVDVGRAVAAIELSRRTDLPVPFAYQNLESIRAAEQSNRMSDYFENSPEILDLLRAHPGWEKLGWPEIQAWGGVAKLLKTPPLLWPLTQEQRHRLARESAGYPVDAELNPIIENEITEINREEVVVQRTEPITAKESYFLRAEDNPLAVLPFADFMRGPKARAIMKSAIAIEQGNETPMDAAIIYRAARIAAALERRGESTEAMVESIVATSLPFMVEFAMTAGLGPLVKKGLVVGAKAVAKNALGKALASAMTSRVAQFAGPIGVRALAAGVPRIAVETVQRLTPAIEIRQRLGEELVMIAETPDDTFWPALGKSVLGQEIAFFVEHLGGVLPGLKPGIAGIAERFPKLVPGLKMAAMSNWLAKNPKATTSDLAKILRSTTGWHNPAMEMVEEEAEKGTRALLGLEPYQPTTGKELLAQAIAFSGMEAGFRAVGRAARAPRIQIKPSNPAYFEDLAAEVAKIKQATQDPQGFRQVAEELSKNAPGRFYHVPFDAWKETVEKIEVAPGAVADAEASYVAAGGSIEEYRESAKLKRDLPFKVADYITWISPTPMAKELARATKASPLEVTPWEFERIVGEPMEPPAEPLEPGIPAAAAPGEPLVPAAEPGISLGEMVVAGAVPGVLPAAAPAAVVAKAPQPAAAAGIEVGSPTFRIIQDVFRRIKESQPQRIFGLQELTDRDIVAMATLVGERFRRRSEILGVDPMALYLRKPIQIGARIPELRKAVAEPGRRARTLFGAGGISIEFLEGARLNSFLHETGHIWLQEMRDDVAELSKKSPETLTPAQRLFLEDAARVLEYLGAPSWDKVDEKMEELWVRTFETYLMEGRSPTKLLRRALKRFKDWLMGIYGQIRLIKAPVNPEIREVMDRLLASQEEIEEAILDQQVVPLVADPGLLAMTEAQARKYEELVSEMQTEAEDRLAPKLMESIKRKETKEWKSEREGVVAEVVSDLSADRNYAALSILMTGKLPNGVVPTLPSGLPPYKLLRSQFVEAFGENRAAELPDSIWSENGRPLDDVVVKDFRFETPGEMVDSLLATYSLERSLSPELRQVDQLQIRLEDLNRQLDEAGAPRVKAAAEAAAVPTAVKLLGQVEDLKDVTEKMAARALVEPDVKKIADQLARSSFEQSVAKRTFEKEAAQAILLRVEAKLSTGDTIVVGPEQWEDVAKLAKTWNARFGKVLPMRKSKKGERIVFGLDMLGQALQLNVGITDAKGKAMFGRDAVPYLIDLDKKAKQKIPTRPAKLEPSLEDVWVAAKQLYEASRAVRGSEEQVAGLREQIEETKTAIRSAQRRAGAIERFTGIIDRIADERMDDLHPEGRMTEEELRGEAVSALHGDRIAELMHAELVAMASDNFADFKKIGRKVIGVARSLKDYLSEAVQSMSGRPIGRISVNAYRQAEATAGREARDAFVEGNWAAAFSARERQLSNHARFIAAQDILSKVTKGLRFIDRMSDTPATLILGKAGVHYVEARDIILEQHEFKRVSARRLGRREALRAYIKRIAEESGEIPQLPDYVIEESRRVNYRDLTFEEFSRILGDLVHLDHLARLKGKLMAARAKRTFEETVGIIVSGIAENFPKAKAIKAGGIPAINAAWDAVKWVGAKLKRMDFLFLKLDGDKALGPVFQALRMPISDSRTESIHLHKRVKDGLDEILKEFSKLTRVSWSYLPVSVEGVEGGALGGHNGLFTMEQIIAVGFNMGNRHNMESVMASFGWSRETMDKVVRLLSERHWEMITKIWKFLDTFREESFELERIMTGRIPEKVEAESFTVTTAEGKQITLPGGFYPIMFDPRLSWLGQQLDTTAEISEIFGRGGSSAMTLHNHLINRSRINPENKVLLRMDVVTRHLSAVVHDLAFRRSIVDGWKLVSDPRVRGAIVGSVGKQMYDELRRWYKDVAGARSEERSTFNDYLVNNTARAFIGMKVTSSLLQTLGLTRGAHALGPEFALRGLKDTYGKPWELDEVWKFITDRDPHMMDRIFNYDRDVRRMMGGMRDVTNVDKLLFGMIGMMDLAVSIPTWMGAYHKAMEGQVPNVAKGDEQAAIEFARFTVRTTQSSGYMEDLPRVQRVRGLARLFTMFYNEQSIIYNQLARMLTNFRRTGDISPLVAGFAMYWWIPKVMELWIRGEGPPDDDDDYLDWLIRQELYEPFQSIVGLRELTRAMNRMAETGRLDLDVTPVGTLAESLVGTTVTVPMVPFREDPMTRTEGRRAFDSLGFIFGLPTRQLWITGEYLHGLMTGEIDPETLPEAIRGLTLGQKRKQK